MQIQKINYQTFGATPSNTTFRYLENLELEGIDTTHIIRNIKNSFAGENVITKLSDDGLMDVYLDKGTGDRGRVLIDRADNIRVDMSTLKLLNPQKFAEKLRDSLSFFERTRPQKQRAYDKVHTPFEN